MFKYAEMCFRLCRTNICLVIYARICNGYSGYSGLRMDICRYNRILNYIVICEYITDYLKCIFRYKFTFTPVIRLV